MCPLPPLVWFVFRVPDASTALSHCAVTQMDRDQYVPVPVIAGFNQVREGVKEQAVPFCSCTQGTRKVLLMQAMPRPDR